MNYTKKKKAYIIYIHSRPKSSGTQRIYEHTHKHTYIHTYKHTHTQTYIHTYKQTHTQTIEFNHSLPFVDSVVHEADKRSLSPPRSFTITKRSFTNPKPNEPHTPP